MTKTTVREAMTAAPSSLASEASAFEAARLMLAENVGSIPIVDGDNLVGIVTDLDLVRQVVAKDLDPEKVTVSEVSSSNPVVARPDEPLDSALQRMAEEQVRRLPVVHQGRLVGILAEADAPGPANPQSTGETAERAPREE